MANHNGTQDTTIANLQEPDVAFVGGRVRAFVENIVYAAQAVGDTLTMAQLPAGALVLGFELITDTSTSTATLAVGDGTTAAKYAAAAAYTTINTPVQVGNTAGPLAGRLTAAGQIVLTIGTLALPASGNLVFITYYTQD
ncbi:MAG: hypothetical protein ACYDB1_01190 [Acidiferrobacteraceae bacterium]